MIFLSDFISTKFLQIKHATDQHMDVKKALKFEMKFTQK